MFDWVIPFIVVLSVLIFVHELGHYLVARRYGVRVETFSIGFGREIFGWTDRAGTRWKVSILPLGGYVKMFGEMDFAEDEDRPQLTPEEQSESFHHKSLGKKAAIVFAGPAANFLFAIVALMAVFLSVGEPSPLSVVGTVQDNSPAAAAGLRSGDEITAIEGQPVSLFEDIRLIVSDRPDMPTSIEIVRDEAPQTLTATPRREVVSGGEEGGERAIGVIGITPDLTRIGYSELTPLQAVGASVERTFGLTAQIITTIGDIITGSRSTEELGGPIRIAQLSGQMAEDGLVNLIFFMAALSVNLGLINLLPVPMLDGGHLMFYGLEAIRGKPVSPRLLEYCFRFGLAFVLLLMVFATWNDIVNLKIFDFFKQLIS
ncbi:MAG: RIP metalloprotease RseP [Rhodospirillales bacterium]|nr:RIP metalloprotease RseP [Rhodospirillales bacterium]